MKHLLHAGFLTVICLTFFTHCNTRKDEAHTTEEDQTVATPPIVSSAKSRIEQWNKQRSVEKVRPIHLFYWHPKNQAPIAGYQERISSLMTEMQDFFREEMQRHGFGPMTFQMETNTSGAPQIHTVTSSHSDTDSHYNVMNYVHEDLLVKFKEIGLPEGSPCFIFVLAPQLEQQQRNPKKPLTTLAIYDDERYYSLRVCNMDSPELTTKSPTNGADTLYHTFLKRNLARNLGILFGLPINNQLQAHRADSPHEVMNYKNWLLAPESAPPTSPPKLSLSSALTLASHTVFTNSAKGISSRVFPNISRLKVRQLESGQIQLSGKVDSSVPAYALLTEISDLSQYYQGRPYTKIIPSPVTDDNLFLSTLPLLRANTEYKINLKFLYVNGAGSLLAPQKTELSTILKTNENGIPDLQNFEDISNLTQLGFLVGANDYSGARIEFERILAQDISDRARSAAEHMTQSFFQDEQHPSPAKIDPSIKSIALSKTAEDSFDTGWGAVTKDRLPTSRSLILDRGELFRHGIYAHANSKGIYKLGGQWQRFSGSVGIAEGKYSSAHFTIIGDGQTLWQSPHINLGQRTRFDIDINDVDTLEILTTHVPGKKNSCWTVWYEPTLSR